MTKPRNMLATLADGELIIGTGIFLYFAFGFLTKVNETPLLLPETWLHEWLLWFALSISFILAGVSLLRAKNALAVALHIPLILLLYVYTI